MAATMYQIEQYPTQPEASWVTCVDDPEWEIKGCRSRRKRDKVVTTPVGKNCRDARECFTTGQRIRHTIKTSPQTTWEGTYNQHTNVITMDNGNEYSGRSPLNNFAASHYREERPNRVHNVNAWNECKCAIDGEWVSTFNL